MLNSILMFATVVTQEAFTPAADQELSGVWQLGLSMYEIIAPLLAALAGWIGMKLNGFLQAKTENELLRGILGRLNESVFDAVKKVNQTALEQIRAAKTPGSAGGSKITAEEAQTLKSLVWDDLKREYGGMGGLAAALSVLGIGDGENGLTSFIDRKIEAAVHDTKITAKAAGNP